ncbi:MAG: AbrB/MazE/SpoVT family DNA-binding domain-containing protein [Actinomycetota bacterium]
MADTGMFRRVDDLGRIVLPAELRKTLGLREGAMLDIFLEDDRIVLTPRHDTCVFCSSRQDLKDFRQRRVCATCATDLGGGNESGSTWEPFAQT